jgi:hypothetical protein
VIALNAGSVHRPHNIKARLWVGAVPDEVSKKRIVSASLFLSICKNGV